MYIQKQQLFHIVKSDSNNNNEFLKSDRINKVIFLQKKLFFVKNKIFFSIFFEILFL